MPARNLNNMLIHRTKLKGVPKCKRVSLSQTMNLRFSTRL